MSFLFSLVFHWALTIVSGLDTNVTHILFVLAPVFTRENIVLIVVNWRLYSFATRGKDQLKGISFELHFKLMLRVTRNFNYVHLWFNSSFTSMITSRSVQILLFFFNLKIIILRLLCSIWTLWVYLLSLGLMHVDSLINHWLLHLLLNDWILLLLKLGLLVHVLLLLS